MKQIRVQQLVWGTENRKFAVWLSFGPWNQTVSLWWSFFSMWCHIEKKLQQGSPSDENQEWRQRTVWLRVVPSDGTVSLWFEQFFLCDGYMFVHPRMVEIQIQRGQSKEEMSTRRALWLRVVPWDGTVSLWWRSVHNPRPSFTIFQLISHQVPHICYVLANGQVDWWTCSNPWRSLKSYIIHFIFVGCLFDWLKCWF